MSAWGHSRYTLIEQKVSGPLPKADVSAGTLGAMRPAAGRDSPHYRVAGVATLRRLANTMAASANAQTTAAPVGTSNIADANRPAK
jgi:hypothetical protein